MKYFVLLCVFTQVYGGTEYLVPLLGHGSADELYYDDITLQLVNPSSADSISVNIDNGGTNSGSGVTVDDQGVYFYKINLDQSVHPVQSQVTNHTLRVYSNDYFGLQVITTAYGYSEGYQAIPKTQLGTEYYVSTFCALGDFCQFVIGSTVAGVTQVYVELPPEVDEIGFCIGNITWFSDTDTTITLEYPQQVQIETTHDLTGTRIYANESVSVLAGSRTSQSTTPIYHLVEQLVPVSDWGTEFYIRPVGTNTYGNIVHIIGRYRRTYVSMTGHPRVELSGPGQTIKRRIDISIETRIHASRIVQVVLYTGFTYGSNETITKPGMTLVPAVEHYLPKYDVTCENTDNDDQTAWQVQIVAPGGVSIQGFPSASSTILSRNVSYERYQFTEYDQGIDDRYFCIRTSDSVLSGIMNCKGSAVFPLGVLSRQEESCIITRDIMHFGDGIDNDCSGQIDEDYCFENKMFETSYSIANDSTFEQTSIHVEDITNWKRIKMRIRMCGDVKIELIADNSANANNATGKFVVFISKESFTVYRCFPNCDLSEHRRTWSFLSDTDCDTLIPYWISNNSTHVCFNIGVYPDFECSTTSQSLPVPSGYKIKQLALHGLYSNAVFYFDYLRADCQGIDSDWRCVDLVTNCWEYEDDLCTSYTEWATINCRKFCGICTPDAVGKVFVAINPEDTYTVEYYAIPDSSDVNYMSVNNGFTHPFSDYNMTLKNGSTITIKKTVVFGSSGARRAQTVYSDADVYLFVRIIGAYGEITIPVYPVDVLGTEYMVVSFSTDLTCDIIAVDGPSEVWKSTRSETSYLGVISVWQSVLLSGDEGVGTVFNSSRPVAIFCGHKNDYVVHHWTQLLPTSSLGKFHVIPAFASNVSTANTSGTARIVANKANTLVHIIGDFEVIHILHERGDHADQILNLESKYTVSSSYSISVSLLYTDLDSDESSFVTVPAVDQFDDNPIMILPSSGTLHELGVVSSSNESTLTSVNATSELLYYIGNSSSFAMAVISEYATADSAFTRTIKQSTQLVKDLDQHDVCTVTKGTPGDGIDNDCDGLVDEEVECFTGYGSRQEDFDLDASFGEDCLVSNPVTPTVSPPDIPICYTPPPVPNNTFNVCYVSTCQCSCSWTESLAAYENMSQAEKDAANTVKTDEIEKVLKVNTEVLSTTVAEKVSAEDNRTSSSNIGYVGIVLLTLVAGLIIFFDCINIYQYFSNKRKTAVEQQ